MKLRFSITLIVAVLFLNITSAQEKVESAKTIMNNAFSKAKVENKNVFVVFSASWCGWCKKMEATMKAPSIERFFNENYVIEKLIVLEKKSKKHLENQGSEEMLNKYGGEKQGIPYYLIFDSDANLLADSKMLKGKEILKNEGTNIGCPGTDYEIDAFLYKLKETSSLTDEELILIAKQFKLNNSN